jgi:RHS repeat-associated protein
MRLLEEYDVSGAQPALQARYYYLNGDHPVAADLAVGGLLKRVYYLNDDVMSVIAVTDDQGQVLERVWYDGFGQPVIESQDKLPPVIGTVVGAAGGALRVALSERVFSPLADPGLAVGIVPVTNTQPVSLQVVDKATQTDIPGGFSVDTSQPALPRGSVVLFTPSQPITGAVSMTLTANTLSDDWGNLNVAQAVDVPVGTNGVNTGTVYYRSPSTTNTGPVRVARSALGSSFLFHGQYFDYDTGLLYLRSRFFDPYSGMFLEPDPTGYEDSVNLYAAFGHNPASKRDPTGLISIRVGPSEFRAMARGIMSLEKNAGRESGAIFRAARLIEGNPALIEKAAANKFFQQGLQQHWGALGAELERAHPGFLTPGTSERLFNDFTHDVQTSGENVVTHLEQSGFRKFSEEKLADSKELADYFTHPRINKYDPAFRKGEGGFPEPRFFGSPFGKERAAELSSGLTKTSNKGGSEIWLRFNLNEEGAFTTEAVRVDRFGHLSNFNDAHYEGMRVGWGEVPHFHKENVPFDSIPKYLTGYVPGLPVYNAQNALITCKPFSNEWLQQSHMWFEQFPDILPGQKLFWQPSW